MSQPDPVGVVGAVFAALYAAHQVADHWVQTDYQAAVKARPGWTGRLACANHVLSYTATAVTALAALTLATGLDLFGWRTAAGLGVSALTHYIADRRTALYLLARATGSGRFWRLGAPRTGRDDNPTLGTGAYALDQSWHIGWLFIAALILA